MYHFTVCHPAAAAAAHWSQTLQLGPTMDNQLWPAWITPSIMSCYTRPHPTAASSTAQQQHNLITHRQPMMSHKQCTIDMRGQAGWSRKQQYHNLLAGWQASQFAITSQFLSAVQDTTCSARTWARDQLALSLSRKHSWQAGKLLCSHFAAKASGQPCTNHGTHQ